MNDFIQLLRMGCVCGRESITIEGRKFYVRSRLGDGGFSFVDLVEDNGGRKFALKRIQCHSIEDEKVALKEVEYMRGLHHQNLIALENAEKHPIHASKRSVISEVNIVMPFYRRGTLHNELEILALKGEHIRETRVLQLFKGICDGLTALHKHKPVALAHRDLKPHNVLLEEDDTPVLMDFGSMGEANVEVNGTSQARALQDLAAERCSMPYRAPELFNVESFCTIDERIDVWSLGCTLYAMCFHESPFDSAYQRGDSIALAVLAPVKFPADTSMYSERLLDLIKAMLVVNPVERPHTDWVVDQVNQIISNRENRV